MKGNKTHLTRSLKSIKKSTVMLLCLSFIAYGLFFDAKLPVRAQVQMLEIAEEEGVPPEPVSASDTSTVNFSQAAAQEQQQQS
ncbi:MAG TPA: hypothetical protein VJT82_06955, partial [Pyrinomonadaceae bacterium]|nr:hypothetical protein [Pyrinomonadaceae bacterium]